MQTKRPANKFISYDQEYIAIEQAEERAEMIYERNIALLNELPKFSKNQLDTIHNAVHKMLPWYFGGGFVAGCLFWWIVSHL